MGDRHGRNWLIYAIPNIQIQAWEKGKFKDWANSQPQVDDEWELQRVVGGLLWCCPEIASIT